jgi:hypothetical protein
MTIKDAIRIHHREKTVDGVDATWLRFQLEAIVNGQSAKIGPFEDVDDAWKGQPCFVVGGSRGLRNAIEQGFRFDMLRGFHTIGINHVIEEYHDFDWLLFLDKRLIDISTYDIMKKYKGRMFAHIKTRLEPSDRTTVFYTQSDGPAEHIVQGLYTFIASGITAINLALVSGANPIYLLGLDNGGADSNKQSTHYKDGYTGEKIGHGNWKKFKTYVPERLLKYASYADRFFNVDPLGDITVFRKIAVRDIPELQGLFK